MPFLARCRLLACIVDAGKEKYSCCVAAVNLKIVLFLQTQRQGLLVSNEMPDIVANAEFPRRTRARYSHRR